MSNLPPDTEILRASQDMVGTPTEQHLAEMCTKQYVMGLEAGSFADQVHQLEASSGFLMTESDYEAGTKVAERANMENILYAYAFELGKLAAKEMPIRARLVKELVS